MDAWESILADPEFRKQPNAVKERVATNYYQQHIASDSTFATQGPDVQERVHRNFMATLEPLMDRPNPIVNAVRAGVQAGITEPRAALNELAGDFDQATNLRKERELNHPVTPGVSSFVGSVLGGIAPMAAAVGATMTAPATGPVGPAVGLALAGYMGAIGAGRGRGEVHTYEERTGEAVSGGKEAAVATLYGAVNAALGVTGLKIEQEVLKRTLPEIAAPMAELYAKRDFKGVAKLLVGSGIVQGAEFSALQATENAISMSYDHERKLSQGIGMAFATGLAGGLVIGPIGAVGQRVQQSRDSLTRVKRMDEAHAQALASFDKKDFTDYDENALIPEVLAKEGPKSIFLSTQHQVRLEAIPDQDLLTLQGIHTDAAGKESVAWSKELKYSTATEASLKAELKPLNTRDYRMSHDEAMKAVDDIEKEIVRDRNKAKRDGTTPTTGGVVTRTKLSVDVKKKDSFTYGITDASGKVLIANTTISSKGKVLGRIKEQVASAMKYIVKRKPDFGQYLSRVEIATPEEFAKYNPSEGARSLYLDEPGNQRIVLLATPKNMIIHYLTDITHELRHAIDITEGNPISSDTIPYNMRVHEARARREEVDMANDFNANAGALRYFQHAGKGNAIPQERVQAQVDYAREAGVPVTGGFWLHDTQLLDGQGRKVNAYYDPPTDSIHFSRNTDVDTVGHELFEHFYSKIAESDPLVQDGIALFGGKEQLADAVGAYYAGKVESRALLAKVQGWLSTFWSKVKQMGGLELTGDDVVRIVNDKMLSRKSYEGDTNDLSGMGPALQVDAFHGTNRVFDVFSDHAIGTGEGHQSFGYGHYVTEGKEIGEHYAEMIGTEGNRVLMRVTLHPGKKANEYFYQDFHKPMKAGHRARVAKDFVDMLDNDMHFRTTIGDVIFMGDDGKFSYNRGFGGPDVVLKNEKAAIRFVQQELAKMTYGDVYFMISREKGPADTSKYMDSIGINGTKYQAGTLSGVKDSEYYNYVVYNPDNIKIADVKQYQQARMLEKKEDQVSSTNVKRLGLDPVERKLVEWTLQDELNPAVPHTETVLKAYAILKDVDRTAEIIERAHQKGDPLTPEEATALRLVAMKATHDLVHDTVFNEVTGDNLEMKSNAYRRIMEANNRAASSAGRLLNVYRISVENALVQLLSSLDRQMRPDERARFAALDKSNPQAVRNFRNSLKVPETRDYVKSMWYNNILSGLPTHLVNTVSNTIWFASMFPHRVVTAGADAMVATLTGRERRIFMREVFPMMAGIPKGLAEGKQAAAEVIKNGIVLTNASKWDQDIGQALTAFERSPHAFLRRIAPMMTGFTRVLRAADVLSNSIAQDAELQALAYRDARMVGLQQGTGAFDAHVNNLLAHPTNEMIEKAKSFARYSTFMDTSGTLANAITGVRNALPGGWLVVPFVRTLSNLLKRGIEFIPGVGVMVQKRPGVDVASIIARQVEGAFLSAVVLSMFDADKITGNVPQAPAERDAFYRQGKIPFAVKIGDTWYSYKRMEPLNTLLSTVAIARQGLLDAKDGEEGYKVFAKVAHDIAMNFVNNSYVSNLIDMFEPASAGRWAQRLPSTFIPYSSFLRSISVLMNNTPEGMPVRDEVSIWGEISNTIFLQNEATQSRLNAFGQPVTIPGNTWEQWWPYKSAKETTDPVELELMRLNKTGVGRVYPAKPDHYLEINGKAMELPNDVYRRYATEYGRVTKEGIAKLMTRGSYQRATDDRKIEMMHSVMEHERARIRRGVKRYLMKGQRLYTAPPSRD